MAIQISEKLLSAKARKALDNAKNKSQLLRDAFEFYVNRENVDKITSQGPNVEIYEDISEIKELLKKLSLQQVLPIVDGPVLKDVFEVVENSGDPEMSEEEKLKIQKQLDASLDLF